MARQNRFLRLPVAFTSSYGKFDRVNKHGNTLWFGIFDASYTRRGDYLVSDSGTFFVASQAPLLPILCVQANRTISVSQPRMQTGVAHNVYGGYTSGNSIVLMDHWPASVLSESKTSHSTIKLPTDQATPYWNVLVPEYGGVVLTPGDIITDDLGQTAVISVCELTDLGWRINAKVATT